MSTMLASFCASLPRLRKTALAPALVLGMLATLAPRLMAQTILPGTGMSSAYAVNNVPKTQSGFLIVGSIDSTSAEPLPCYWTSTTRVALPLPMLPTGVTTSYVGGQALSVNNSGVIAGWVWTAVSNAPNPGYGFYKQACEWVPGVGGAYSVVSLGGVGSNSIAYGINTYGVVVGDVTASSVTSGFRWTPPSGSASATVSYLPTRGGVNSGARAINDYGIVAGYADASIPNPPYAPISAGYATLFNADNSLLNPNATLYCVRSDGYYGNTYIFNGLNNASASSVIAIGTTQVPSIPPGGGTGLNATRPFVYWPSAGTKDFNARPDKAQEGRGVNLSGFAIGSNLGPNVVPQRGWYISNVMSSLVPTTLPNPNDPDEGATRTFGVNEANVIVGRIGNQAASWN